MSVSFTEHQGMLCKKLSVFKVIFFATFEIFPLTCFKVKSIFVYFLVKG